MKRHSSLEDAPMLRTPAPYPHVGSFALWIDHDLPAGQQRAELARILRVGPLTAAIALPLRVGASGNVTVALGDLIDGTPLTRGEDKELRDLQLHIRQRVRPRPDKVTRAETLRQRAIFSILLGSELAKLNSLTARADQRQGASAGAIVPDLADAA